MQQVETCCPLFLTPVPAGFPSPAEDVMEGALNLHHYVVKHPAATFFVRATGDSMVPAGIHSGDILVVDRALEPKDGQVVIAALDGELTVKRLRQKQGQLFLVADNAQYPPIEVKADSDTHVWGVVTYALHALH